MALKIIVFTDCYLPYNSGVVHSIELLKKQVSSMGHQVFIFAPAYPGYEKKEEPGIYRINSVPAVTNKSYYLAMPMYRCIKNHLKSIQPDIIHTHHPFSLGWMGMYFARAMDRPLVYTCHTLYEYYSHYLPLPRLVSTMIIRKLCFSYSNRCDLIITPTIATMEYLKNLGVVKSFKVIPTGVEFNNSHLLHSNWLRKNFGIEPGDRILLCVSRLGPEKNLIFLLHCFVEVSRVYPNTKLVLVGKGPQKKELKKLAANLGIGKKVVFTGLLPKEDVYKCYLSSDIFVFASISETQGLVIPEAKSAGLPIVAVNANGVSEMIENGVDGFLTNFSREHFVEKILLLLNNQELRMDMSRKARLNVEELSSNKYATNLINLYYSLIRHPQNKTTG